MLTPQVFHLPHFLEDQYVWLSIAAWGVLLTWLWPRISRRRLLMWLGLTAALHLTPVTAQVIRATSAITVMAHDMPVTFWALQGVNVLVLAMIVSIWYVSQRRVARYRQLQAVLAERRRIANDLHDGVGSRLVALLASQDPKSAEPDGLSMALQACLLELQMTVDSTWTTRPPPPSPKGWATCATGCSRRSTGSASRWNGTFPASRTTGRCRPKRRCRSAGWRKRPCRTRCATRTPPASSCASARKARRDTPMGWC
jgi:hypothetical protein